MPPVPNQFPDKPSARRICIIGEAPGTTEAREGRPFVGPSGFRLDRTLQEVGLSRDQCFVGNVCQVQPPANEIKAFKWTGPEIQDGLAQLRADLATFQPHFCLLLGGTPLKAFKGDLKASISDWRGSLFVASDIAPGVKCMATWHPAATLRDDSLGPVMRFDFARAAKEAQTDGLDLPSRHIEIIDHSNLPMLFSLFQAWKTNRSTVSADIEGGVSDVSCIGFAISPFEAVVVPFTRKDGSSVWTEDEEVLLWTAIRDLLEDVHTPKVLQNYLYDAFVLAWTHGILIRGLRDDTMLKHFELFCELEKSLGFQASLYTKQPFYKGDRKSNDDETFYRYCGMDCCVTYECSIAQDKKLSPAQRKHYEFNMRLLPALLYMELRGIRYDRSEAKRTHARVQRRAWAVHDLLNKYAGRTLPTNEADFIALVARQLCLAKPRKRYDQTTTKTYKNGKTKTTTKRISEPVAITTWDDCRLYAKDSCRQALERVSRLVEQHVTERTVRLHRSVRGELSVLLATHLRCNSTGPNGDARGFLYETCGFPPQYAKEGNKLTDRLTTDDQALIKIWCKTEDPRARAFLRFRKLDTELETLRASCDDDGRIRCGYNLVGSETARLSCYESPTGSGYNLQTVTKKHRHLFVADEGCLLAQCDLAGADGWTVAAYAAQQGDRNMMEDYRAGLKPAKITALLYEQGSGVNGKGRDELKGLCKSVSQDGWLYFACKRVQHGSSYAMGVRTMADQILTDSYKMTGDPVAVDAATCERIQRAFFVRYPGIKRWHDWMARELKTTGQLAASIGFTRRFYGRKDDQSTLRAALAHLPQVYTTAATKLALWRLWSDPENRRSDGSLRIEPLHTVHDSLVSQFAEGDRAWAASKIKDWFNNTLVIAGQPIIIPWEGGCGPNWKETTEPL